uniref:SANT domain-containing protein n=1 Tax=Ananas comosus var. bracteatus TaxID=296719 RepID=A0A6V7PL41_ANACO|nr:unnamed protein product [Ananas comosus var. bracteatus]
MRMDKVHHVSPEPHQSKRSTYRTGICTHHPFPLPLPLALRSSSRSLPSLSSLFISLYLILALFRGGEKLLAVEREQERAFFSAFIEDKVDKWERIAAKISGKTAEDVKAFHDEMAEDISQIEAGFVPLPDCDDEPECPESDGKGKQPTTLNQRKNQKWTLQEHL